jgi:cytochrome c553
MKNFFRDKNPNGRRMKSAPLLLALMAQAGKDKLATPSQMKVSGVDLNIPPVSHKGQRSLCTVCHGPTGMPIMPNATHLAGQSAIHLVEQLSSAQH